MLAILPIDGVDARARLLNYEARHHRFRMEESVARYTTYLQFLELDFRVQIDERQQYLLQLEELADNYMDRFDGTEARLLESEMT